MEPEISLDEFYNQFPSEQACSAYLERLRWSRSIVCPHCETSEAPYRFSNGLLYKCSKCRKQFSVRIGTVLGDSKVPLQKWLLAIYLATNAPQGISTLQLSKYLGITQKSSWYMVHKIKQVLNLKN